MSKKIAVLCSGGGTNLQALIDAVEAGGIDGEIVLVLANASKAFALSSAQARHSGGVYQQKQAGKRRGLTTSSSKAARGERRSRRAGGLSAHRGGRLCGVEHRIINIHPALIPAFCGPGMYGHHVHEAVLAYGAKISGATTHFVDEQVDHGGVIMQRASPCWRATPGNAGRARAHRRARDSAGKRKTFSAREKLGVDGRQVHVL